MDNINMQRNADMKMRESALIKKMMERIENLEKEVQEIQAKLYGTVKLMAEKDEELKRLKSQILQNGIDALDQNIATKQQYQTSLESDSLRKNKTKFKKTPYFSTINKENNLKQFNLNSEQVESETRLSQTIEERIKRAKALANIHQNCPDDPPAKQKHILHEGTMKNGNKLEVGSSISEYFSNSSNDSERKTCQEMKEECQQLMCQLQEMEKFLGDYGLIWVGEMDVPDENNSSQKVEASLGFTPNFDKLIMVIGKLNERRASETEVEISGNIGKFKNSEVLKLVIYADGIQLEDDPFREYSSESVQEFFGDLEDGYYPTELKGIYPDGVIFRVIDKRFENYAESKGEKLKPFSGKGQKLGGNYHPVPITKTKLPSPDKSGATYSCQDLSYDKCPVSLENIPTENLNHEIKNNKNNKISNENFTFQKPNEIEKDNSKLNGRGIPLEKNCIEEL